MFIAMATSRIIGVTGKCFKDCGLLDAAVQLQTPAPSRAHFRSQREYSHSSSRRSFAQNTGAHPSSCPELGPGTGWEQQYKSQH